MAFLDSLLALSSGAGRGYKASQAEQRSIAEQKRKALLENRQMALQESDAASVAKLRELQGSLDVLQNQIGQFNLASEKSRASYLDMPISKNAGDTIDFNILGNKISIPNKVRALQDFAPLLSNVNREDLMIQHPEIFGTRTGASKLTPEQEAALLKAKLLGIAQQVSTSAGQYISDPEAKTRLFQDVIGLMGPYFPGLFPATQTDSLLNNFDPSRLTGK